MRSTSFITLIAIVAGPSLRLVSGEVLADLDYLTTLPAILADTNNFPNNCSHRELKHNQPNKKRNAFLPKCCPIGEGLNNIDGNQQDGALCTSTDKVFHVDVVNVTLYDNCIEDMETAIELPFAIGNPCNESFLYNKTEDVFFVAQDGSLVVMDAYANTSYAQESRYCVDIENNSGTTFAIVCITAADEHIDRSIIVVVAVLMLISIPCLLLVSYVHIKIKELRSLHGMTLSVMSACLATGYFLYSLVHIFNTDDRGVGYAVQFFILSYYFWFFCLTCNALINVWVHLSHLGKLRTYAYFGGYCAVGFCGPLVLVLMTVRKGLPGMPSYFMQGTTESIRESQRFFIPPVSCLLFLSFLVMSGCLLGLQKIKTQWIAVASDDESARSPEYMKVRHKYEEVRKDAKCISFLGVILICAWLLEIVTFYSPDPQNYFVLMDMVNGLQGVFVLLIFLVVRRRRNVIFRWWIDRGSLTIDSAELNPH